MKTKKNRFFVLFIITYTLFFSTAATYQADYHLSNLLYELYQISPTKNFPLRTPSHLTQKKSLLIEKKIKNFAQTIEHLLKKTDQTMYKHVFKKMGEMIGSDSTNQQALLDDFLNFYELEKTEINKNIILLDVISFVNDYQNEHPESTNLDQLAFYVFQNLAKTAGNINNPITIKKKDMPKKSWIKRKHILYLISLLSITLTIVVGVALYKKIKENLKKTEALANKQAKALKNTRQEALTHAQGLAQQQKENLEKAYQETLQHINKNKKTLQELEQTIQLEKQELQEHVQTSKKEQQQTIEHIHQRTLEALEKNRATLQELEQATQQTKEQFQSYKKTNKKLIQGFRKTIMQTSLETKALKDRLDTFSSLIPRTEKLETRFNLLEGEIKTEMDVIEKSSLESNQRILDYMKKKQNDTGVIKSFFSLAKKGIELVTSATKETASESRNTGFGDLVARQQALDLASIQIPTAIPIN